VSDADYAEERGRLREEAAAALRGLDQLDSERKPPAPED
jgi:hypothetical protein